MKTLKAIVNEIEDEKRQGSKLDEYQRALDSWVKALDKEEYATGSARLAAEHNIQELIKMVKKEYEVALISAAFNKGLDVAIEIVKRGRTKIKRRVRSKSTATLTARL